MTGLLIVTVFVAFLLRFLLQRHASRGMERDLLAEGKKAIDTARPDKRKELEELHRATVQALATLKRVGAAVRPALVHHRRPPRRREGHRDQGVRPPIPARARREGTAPGRCGTRNCQWWFTNDAALLDTAGRYATEDDDQQEWFAFLDIPRRYRPRKPINGLIVALSISDIESASAEQIAAIAKQIRARLDEITTHLKMLVPIYVVLTKVDMVEGFREFWDDLRPSEREQAWGMAFGLDGQGEPRERFEREFDLLLQTLYGRATRRLHGERRVAMRRALWSFPQVFSALRSNLSEFVVQLFAENAFQETPILRGVFFTSGTQNERASSRVLAAIGTSIGIKLPSLATDRLEPKGYFLTNVFRRVIFPDRDLAGRTKAEKRRQLLVRVGAAVVAMAMSVSLILPAAVTWMHNRELIDSTSAVDSGVRAVSWTSSIGLEQNTVRLDAARERLLQLASWKESGPPANLRWGMYVGDSLYSSLRGVYVGALARLVIGPTKRELESRLRALDTGPVRTSEHFNRDYDTLKLYLMLGDGPHMDADWAAPRLLRIWSETTHAQTEGDEGLLMVHVKEVFTMLHHGELRPWELDTPLVGHSRSILEQVPQTERLYESLVRDANTSIQAIRREQVFYGASAKFVQSKKSVRVAGAYTKAGWQKVRALLGEEREKLASEQWVLSDPDDTNGQATIDKLRTLYFDRYQAAWRDFLDDLFVQDPENGDVALDELNALAEPEWPYLRLIRLVSDNVTLEMNEGEGKGLLERAVDKAKDVLDGGTLAPKRVASPVERAFRPMLRFALPPKDRRPTTPLQPAFHNTRDCSQSSSERSPICAMPRRALTRER